MNLLLATFVLCHVFAVISWLGAMYFNLVLIFPGYRQSASTSREEVKLFKVQGTRAAPWLYAFIIFTFLSGIGYIFFSEDLDRLFSAQLIIKEVCLLGMLMCHLIGSFYVWPRIMFASDNEIRSYLFQYKITMFISAALGSIAVITSYLPIFPQV